jgi:hypothetical protein
MGGVKSGKARVKFLLGAHQALVRRRPPGRGAGQAGGLMLGEHLIHPVLSATDLGTARDSHHDRLGPGSLPRAKQHRVPVRGRHPAGADLGEPTWTRPMCRPLHDRACAMVSFSRARPLAAPWPGTKARSKA